MSIRTEGRLWRGLKLKVRYGKSTFSTYHWCEVSMTDSKMKFSARAAGHSSESEEQLFQAAASRFESLLRETAQVSETKEPYKDYLNKINRYNRKIEILLKKKVLCERILKETGLQDI